MIRIYDLDVRALAPVGLDIGPDASSSVLARLGRWARFAALCGLHGIGAVGRFSAMRGPGVLQALQGVDGADEGLLLLGDRARVLPGGVLWTEEGVQLLVFGPPRALISFAQAFPVSLFHGSYPSLADATREATVRGLLPLAWAEGDSREDLLALAGKDGSRALAGLLVGPETAPPRALARMLGRPVAGGSRAVRRSQIGLRLTAMDVDREDFASVRRSFADGTAIAIAGRGPVRGAVIKSAAALSDLLDSARSMVGLL